MLIALPNCVCEGFPLQMRNADSFPKIYILPSLQRSYMFDIFKEYVNIIYKTKFEREGSHCTEPTPQELESMF